MIYVRCKQGRKGLLVLAGKLQRIHPGWSGFVPRSVYLTATVFLEPAQPPAVQEVGPPADPFRRGDREAIHGEDRPWSRRAA